MADPQVENGYVRLSNELHEQIMVSYFTERQIRILELIIRLSYGCQKKVAYIPKQSYFEIVGVGEGHIKNQLDLLIRDKVITRDDNYYTINKDYDQWRVSRAKGYSPQNLTDMVSLNLHIKKEPAAEYPDYPLAGYIYIAKGENDLYKVGFSKDPAKRCIAFLGLPFEVELVWSCEVKDTGKAEASIKTALKSCNVKNEWYRLQEQDISKIKDVCSSYLIGKPSELPNE